MYHPGFHWDLFIFYISTLPSCGYFDHLKATSCCLPNRKSPSIWVNIWWPFWHTIRYCGAAHLNDQVSLRVSSHSRKFGCQFLELWSTVCIDHPTWVHTWGERIFVSNKEDLILQKWLIKQKSYNVMCQLRAPGSQSQAIFSHFINLGMCSNF